MKIHRFDRLDALRGLAMVWMTVFHFVFDLRYFRLVAQDVYRDPFWTWQRTLIVSLFLLCAGLGQAMASAQRQSWQRFWRRWGQVAGAAALVTVGSWLMFPHSFIYFGVLHGLALMLILVRLTAHWGNWLWPLGALAIASKFVAEGLLQTGPLAPWADDFNSMRWNWLGWISQKPVTEDYVPLFPWLGVMWWGAAAGAWLIQKQPDWLARPLPQALRVLAKLGRWSLSYYLLHQPVMIALVGGFSLLLK